MLEIYTDGASRGNPGKSAIAGVIVKDKQIIKVYAEFCGITTNNVAEYSAIIKALDEAIRLRESRVRVLSDSELVISQILGKYKVKAIHLAELFEEVSEKSKMFSSVVFENLPRENHYIAIADKLTTYILGAK
ncbi:MAG: ribonuclease HI family protein [Caldisericaceae bacterium]